MLQCLLALECVTNELLSIELQKIISVSIMISAFHRLHKCVHLMSLQSTSMKNYTTFELFIQIANFELLQNSISHILTGIMLLNILSIF